jgi:hypothetical protein
MLIRQIKKETKIQLKMKGFNIILVSIFLISCSTRNKNIEQEKKQEDFQIINIERASEKSITPSHELEHKKKLE